MAEPIQRQPRVPAGMIGFVGGKAYKGGQLLPHGTQAYWAQWKFGVPEDMQTRSEVLTARVLVVVGETAEELRRRRDDEEFRILNVDIEGTSAQAYTGPIHTG